MQTSELTDRENAKPQAADDDPIAHLHKMSTTAGLGSADYVAVNPVAVFAALVGLASTLALADNVLLFVPLVGVVLAVIALYQIRHSNGTQTGRGLAWLGACLSFALAALVAGRWIEEKVRTRDDDRAITHVITDFGNALRDGQYDRAYSLCSQRFMGRVSKTDFADRVKSVRESAIYGKFQGAGWNEIAQYAQDESSGLEYAHAQIQLLFDKTSDPPREDVVFRKEGDQWRIDNLPTIFPPSKQQQPQ